MLVLWGTESLHCFVYTVNPRVNVFFSCKALLFCLKPIKENSMASVDQAVMVKWKQTILSTLLTSTSSSGWSTAGVADSKLNQSINFSKVLKCLPYKPSNGYP